MKFLGGKSRHDESKFFVDNPFRKDTLSIPGIVKRCILVGSGKGGVGKTSVSVALALEMSRYHKIGLLDADVKGPDVMRMLGLTESTAVIGEKRLLLPVPYSENLKVFSSSMLFGPGLGIAWKGEQVRSFLEQAVLDVEWGPLDYFICDLEPSAYDSISVLRALFGDKIGVVLVTTPRQVSLDDVRRMADICRDRKMDVLGVIGNMTGGECPTCGSQIGHCGMHYLPFGSAQTVRDFSTIEGIPYLGDIPFNPLMAERADRGSLLLPEPAMKTIRGIAQKVDGVKYERTEVNS